MMIFGRSIGAPLLALAVLACISQDIASAQTAVDPVLQKLVQTPQYQANIAKLFASLPADVFQRCSTLVSTGSKVTVIQPVSYAADGGAIAGSWRQSFPVSGCGNDTTINFYFTAQASKSIDVTVAAPGDTHANLVLQRDAANYVMLAVRVKAAACTNQHLQQTRFDGRLAKGDDTGSATGHGNAGGWNETWTVWACGQIFTVPLTFIPDSTGTRIVAAPAVAKTR